MDDPGRTASKQRLAPLLRRRHGRKEGNQSDVGKARSGPDMAFKLACIAAPIGAS